MKPGLAYDDCGDGWIIFLRNGDLWSIGKRNDDDMPMIRRVFGNKVETYQENQHMFRQLTQVWEAP